MNLENKIFNWALKKLTIRDYSELELFDKIKKKFEIQDSMLIKETLDKLKGYNYLSNERYAESRVKGLISKKYGPNMILLKLSEKGISRTLTNTEIEKHQTRIELNLEKLIESKLSNKGYELGMIFKKVDEFLAKNKN